MNTKYSQELRVDCENLSQIVLESLKTSEQIYCKLQVLLKNMKEISSNLSEVKTKMNEFIETLASDKLHDINYKLEQNLFQNEFKFEVTA